MASMSDYLENKLIDHLFRTTTFNQPSVIAIALCTAAPNDASTGATIPEVKNVGSYARQTLNPGDNNWSANQGGITSNTIAITFPTATADWGIITHIAIIDSETYGAGNMLFWGTMTSNKIVSNGDTFQFAINQIIVQIDN